MRGIIPAENLLFDPEIEKTIRKNRSFLRKKKKAMTEVPPEILDQIRTETEEQLRAEYVRTNLVLHIYTYKF